MNKTLKILTLIVDLLGIIIMSGLISLIALAIFFMLFINDQVINDQANILPFWFKITLFLLLIGVWAETCYCMHKEHKAIEKYNQCKNK